jgi:hypothetical protein
MANNMVPPTPLSGYMFKIVIFMNAGPAGWSDVFYYNSIAGTPQTAWTDVQNAVINLVIQRVNLSANNVQILGARITSLNSLSPLLTSAQQAVLMTPTQLGAPPAGGPTPITLPPLSVVCSLATSPPGLKRTWELRGVSHGAMDAGGGTVFGLGIGTSTSGALLAWSNALIAGFGVKAAPFTGNFCLRGRVRPTVGGATVGVPASQLYALNGIGLDATSRFLTFSVLNPTPYPFLVGQTFLARGVRISGGKGANGQFLVTKVDQVTTPGTTILTTTRPWRYVQSPIPKALGSIYGLVYGLYAIGTISPQRLGTRATGRPTLGTRGRRPVLAG